MRAQFLVGLRTLLVLTVVCGLAYPLAVTGVAQLAFAGQANGSLVERDGKVVGSELLGQAFRGREYFQPRPSAAGAAASGSLVDVLDANGEATGETEAADVGDLSLVASGASNLGPTNEDFLAIVAERVVEYRQRNGLASSARVPVDAVTASGSGLDPHISVANATLQARPEWPPSAARISRPCSISSRPTRRVVRWDSSERRGSTCCGSTWPWMH